MRRALAALAFLVVALAGCGPSKRLVAFNEEEYAAYAEPGSCTITGQAFLRTRGGEVRVGAGMQVVMAPQTSYTREAWERTILPDSPTELEPADPRAKKYGRETVADGEGRFEFTDLPVGSYYLACGIEWEVPVGYTTMRTGGIAHGEATLRKQGETVKVVVTR